MSKNKILQYFKQNKKTPGLLFSNHVKKKEKFTNNVIRLIFMEIKQIISNTGCNVSLGVITRYMAVNECMASDGQPRTKITK